MFLGKKKMILPVHFCDSLSAFRLFVNQFLTYGEGVGLEGYKRYGNVHGLDQRVFFFEKVSI